jgi:AraC-like DNA-binding protein
VGRKQPNLNVVLAPSDDPSFGSCRLPPAPDLAHLVEWYWMSWWDRRGRPAHVVEILTDSACHLVFEPGATNVVGVVTRTFRRRLEGAGGVVGIKLRPAALRPFTGRSTAEFTDRRVPLAQALVAVDVRAAEAEVLGPSTPAARAAAAQAFVRAHLPAPDPNLALLQALVTRIEAERALTSVDLLAEAAAVPVRRLQRLFQEYVGVGPKWVIQRCRLLEAAERIRDGEAGNLAALAAALGYFDQAHFAHAFKAVIGRTPVDYAREASKPKPAR